MYRGYSFNDLADEAKDTNTEGKYAYLVALCVGGIMERPEITYEDPQIIYADSEYEAKNKYDELNRCSYFYGSVLRKLNMPGRKGIVNSDVSSHIHYSR